MSSTKSDKTLSTERKPVTACIETEMRSALPRLLQGLTPKAIAQKARANGARKATEHAAKTWKNGGIPAAPNLCALERAYPEIAAEMRRIRALPGENPSEVKSLAALLLEEIRSQTRGDSP